MHGLVDKVIVLADKLHFFMEFVIQDTVLNLFE